MPLVASETDYKPTPARPPPTSPPTTPRSNLVGILIGCLSGVVVICMLVLLIGWFVWTRRRRPVQSGTATIVPPVRFIEHPPLYTSSTSISDPSFKADQVSIYDTYSTSPHQYETIPYTDRH